MGVINNILDFSKIDTGKLSIEPADFDLPAGLTELANLHAPRAREKGLDLAFSVQPDVPRRLRGDWQHLRRILENLVDNAIKFTERGTIQVQALVDSRNKAGLTLHWSVRDTGIGIAPDKQKLIFDPFVQADGSSTRQYGGAGLGLTITARLVELMGGRIWLESAPGQGSVFHFTVRLEASAAASDAEQPSTDVHDVVLDRADANESEIKLDRGAILERLNGDEELLNEIVQLFLTRSSEMLDEVRTALADRDYGSIHQSAHGLKGAVCTFSRARLFEILQALEDGAAGADRQATKLAFQSLANELPRFHSALAQLAPAESAAFLLPR